VEERDEYVSIAEAATLLGVHRNTIRNRIKVGRYQAHKVVTPQGETYAIARASLGVPAPTPTNEPSQSLSRLVRPNPDKPSQPHALVSTEQQAQADAIVQRLLAPFIAELGTVREELGKVKAERDQFEREREELRRRAEVAEAALAAASAPPAAPPPPSTAPTPSAATDTPEAPGAAGGFWQRVRRALGGE